VSNVGQTAATLVYLRMVFNDGVGSAADCDV